MRGLGRVGINILANYAGNIFVGLLSLAFIPLYITYLGIGGYGLVGFYLTLQSVFSLLDLGLSTTLNRQLATIRDDEHAARDARDLVRTLEAIYWTTAIVIGLTVIVAAPLIANYYVTSSVIAPAVVQRAIALMGVSIALQWPAALYIGGLQGLQRQVLTNIINVVVAFVRGVGAVLILAFVASTVPAYFAWQIVGAALQTLLAGLFLWRSLAHTATAARVRFDLLRRFYRFAAGIVGIGILSTLLTQIDKIVLISVLPLEQFGYYTLAGVVAAALYRLISPVFTAVFPRFTQAADRDPAALPRLYHRSAQIVSVATIPAAVVLIVYAPEVLRLWTGNAVAAANTAPILRLLVAGTAINGLLTIPYALQLAYAWTSLSLTVNTVSVIVIAPSMWYAATHFGGVGAAGVWVVLNLSYLFVGVQFMYRRYLRAERSRWYAIDIGGPLFTSVVVAVGCRLLWVAGLNRGQQIVFIAAVCAATLGATALFTPSIREMMLKRTAAPRLAGTR